MSKCKKVKNPCKICLGSVTQKTGLQCQGACECWVHYACLNYTPGKIKDIKAGIIKVTCPCPDCKSALPRETRTDEPFSCTNMKCPANHPPKCGNTACPINKDMDGPDKMNQTSTMKTKHNNTHTQQQQINVPPLSKCGTECKNHSHPNKPGAAGLPTQEPLIPHAGAMPVYGPRPRSPSDSKCLSGCSSAYDVPGDFSQSPMEGMPSLSALEQMCNTVGQLTNQINCLMNKMRQVVLERSGGGGGGGCGGAGGCGGVNPRVGTRNGPKSTCPKPCYCPGNPGRRN